MKLEEIIKSAIDETLLERGLLRNENKEDQSAEKNNMITESYVTEAGHFDLKTELLSKKTKTTHYKLMENYIKKLNIISSKLDNADRENSNSNFSYFRNLKVDESYNHNAAFLHGLYFENISDVNSQITVDSLTYMKLARDFGTFDKWQEDFVACCLSSRNGWVVTSYNMQLNRYINSIIDLHSDNVMIGSIPVIVLDCWEHSYFRDYLNDKKSYIYGMMKELNWNIIEKRIEKTEAISKVKG
jgi:superoxide dismutase, Fe-Mn family